MAAIAYIWTFLPLILVTGFVYARPGSRPHIIYIMADDLGFRDVGYHDSSIRTPNIDRMSAEGVRLEQHYVLPTCGPSRASFLTGRYQTRHGMYTNIKKSEPRGLSTDIDTFPEKLQQNGYATHLVGKWHQGFYKEEYLPTNRGFDNFVGIALGSSGHYTYSACIKHKGRQVCGTAAYKNTTVTKKFRGKYSSVLFGDKACNIIETHGKTKNEKPLFMFLSLTAPHNPLEAPTNLIRSYNVIKNVRRRKYLAMVSKIDELVGRIKATLVQQGMWKNSIIVFSSDNGGISEQGGNNWPLRGQKGSMYEGGIRTPAFVASPLIPSAHRGRVSRDLIHVTDWYPTFLTLAGVPYGEDIDGTNMWSTISKSSPGPSRLVLLGMYSSQNFRNITTENCRFDTSLRAGIRDGDWKLITGYSRGRTRIPPPGSTVKDKTPPQPADGLRLYNLLSDPFETTNMADKKPEKVQRYCRLLENFRKTGVPFSKPDGDPRGLPKRRNRYSWRPWA